MRRARRRGAPAVIFRMRRYQKTFIPILAAVSILIGAIFIASRTIVISSFESAEHYAVQRDLDRTVRLLMTDVEHLGATTGDYSSWDDSYAYVQSRGKDFEDENLTAEAFSKLRLNLVVYLDSKGQIIYGKTLAPNIEQMAPLPEYLASLMKPGSPLTRHDAPESRLDGFLNTDGGLLILSSRPVLTGHYKGPVQGTLVMGRFMNRPEIERLSKTGLTRLDLFAIDATAVPDDVRSARLAMEGGVTSPVIRLGDKDVAGYTMIRDVLGRPSAILKAQMPRMIFTEGKKAINVFLFWFAAIGFTSALILTVLANRMNLAIRQSRESRNQLKDVVETANSIILTWDNEGRMTFVNDFMERFFGYTRDELIGRNVVGTIVPESETTGRDLAHLMEEIQRDPERYRDSENENITKDGRRVWIHWANKALFDEEGRLTGILSIGNDITERRRAEDELRASEARFRTIIEGASEGIWVAEIKSRRSIYANPTMCRLLGYTNDELIKLDLNSILRPEDQLRALKTFKEQSREKGDPAEFELMHKDGSTVRLSVNSVPLELGGQRCLVGFFTDVSQRTQLEAERLKSQKLEAIGILAGGIAHDFNNLLQGVFGYISLARLNLHKPEKARTLLDEAEKAVHLSVNLTTQLLTFSKGGKPIRKKVQLVPVIEQAARFALSGSRLEFELHLASDLKPVDADAGQLGQVIQNLVLNADQAMPLGGTIVIGARNVRSPGPGLPRHLQAGDYVAITVKDTGIGIPESYIDRIFDPYFTTKEKGSGLGLASAYSIVKNHGGAMDVKSRSGEGTSMTVYLPAAEDDPSPDEMTPATERTTSRPARLLFMDDEEIIRKVAEDMIENLGHEVVFACHGDEAIEKFREARAEGRPFDAVILDLTIRGGKGGEETLRELVKIAPDVKTIVSSGFSDKSTMSVYLAKGFSACLSKPYRITDLASTLSSLL